MRTLKTVLMTAAKLVLTGLFVALTVIGDPLDWIMGNRAISEIWE